MGLLLAAARLCLGVQPAGRLQEDLFMEVWKSNEEFIAAQITNELLMAEQRFNKDHKRTGLLPSASAHRFTQTPWVPKAPFPSSPKLIASSQAGVLTHKSSLPHSVVGRERWESDLQTKLKSFLSPLHLHKKVSFCLKQECITLICTITKGRGSFPLHY